LDFGHVHALGKGHNSTASAILQSSVVGLAVTNDEVFSRAMVAFWAGNAVQAERLFKKLVAASPRHANGLNLLGAVLTQQGRWAEAEPYLKRALRESTSSDATFYNYGVALKGLGRPAEAVDQFDRALTINPSVADTWNNRGAALNDLQRFDEAIASFDKAIAINPGYVLAYSNRGNSLVALQRHDEALQAYRTALGGAPDLPEAWLGCGNVHTNLRQFDRAAAAYDRAFALKPDLDFLRGARLHAKQHICEWADLEAETSRLVSRIAAGQLPSVPFALFALSASPEVHFRCAVRYAASHPTFPMLWRGERYGHERIRVAYLSSDFREHPVAAQILGLLRRHDRTRFEITAISTGPDDSSELRQRIAASSDHFIDAARMSDQKIAELIRQAEIDVAVDLNGLTAGGRLGILARRPAAIQVGYLGYAGTIGAGQIDYILADAVAVPSSEFSFFSEKVVWLPGSFWVSDDQREIAKRTPTRGECGLPESGFVFCGFNGTYKITPAVFGAWMRLLQAIEGSVLWLSETSGTAKANLWREAGQCGIAPERLIFAPRLASAAEHLARHRQADLFLDTTPYGAHSTASDALWSGLPVLTIRSSAFPGRVAASLLEALGLPQLIAPSLHEYEAMALRLARNPADLQALRSNLSRNRVSAPLFDTERSARHIEAAYAMMYGRLHDRQRPTAFAVKPTE
jgi:protein O-GlcNAc transferase